LKKDPKDRPSLRNILDHEEIKKALKRVQAKYPSIKNYLMMKDSRLNIEQDAKVIYTSSSEERDSVAEDKAGSESKHEFQSYDQIIDKKSCTSTLYIKQKDEKDI